jgi:hypothetical protein
MCPLNYYNDPTMTSNGKYCTKCITGCLACTTATACQSCQNVTDPITSIITNYFKAISIDSCEKSCLLGYFGNVLSNKC